MENKYLRELLALKRWVELFEQREILWNLTAKSLKGKYAGSVLGILWAFINPVLLALIVGFVFTDIFKMSAANSYLFVVSGMLPWAFFSGAVQESALSIPANASILKQFSFPRVFIPLSTVLANFILFAFSLLVVIPLYAAVSDHVFLMLPLLFLALAALLFFTLGLALVVSAVCVGVRDVNQALVPLLMFWLWLTPVFYSLDMVPMAYRMIFSFNPMLPYMALFRGALLNDMPVSALSLWLALGTALVTMIAGLCVFFRSEGGFLKRI
jgi:ABC-type polysaccharide/polyol phosphate export permease